MRKVLLATTALVALGGVSAASADISVSGANEFKYKSWSDNTAETGGANKNSFSNTTSYEISASVVTDNGLAMSSNILQDGSTGPFDDYGFSIAGDFGTLGFANSEDGDAFATATDVTPDETNTLTSTAAALTALPGDEHINSADVSYLSPNISGFQFSVGLNEVGSADDSMMGAQYSMTTGETTITVKYATQSGGKASTAATATETDATSTGLVLANGPFSVTVASNTKTVATNGATTYDYNISSIGGTYKMSDSLTVSAYTGTTEDDKDSSHEMTDTAFGVAYTITPGLVFNVTHNSWDLKDNDLSANESGDVTSVALNLSF
jgi:hypothetical protein